MLSRRKGSTTISRYLFNQFLIATLTVFIACQSFSLLFAKVPVLLWTKCFKGTDYDRGNAILKTAEGGFMVAGLGSPFYKPPYAVVFEDMLLLKANSLGDTIWEKKFVSTPPYWPTSATEECAYSLSQLSDGGYVLGGYAQTLATGDPFAGKQTDFIVRTDPSGELLWGKRFGTGWTIYATCPVSDSGFVALGYGYVGGDPRNVEIYRFGKDSIPLWKKNYSLGSDYGGAGYDIISAPGGFVFAGFAGNNIWGLKTQAWIVRLNLNGDTIWSRTYGGIQYEQANAIVKVGNDAFVFACKTSTDVIGDYRNRSTWLVKINLLGDTIWSRVYKDTCILIPRSLISTSDSGFLIIGEFGGNYTNSYGDKTFFLKADKSGSEQWRYIYRKGLCNDVVEASPEEYVFTGSTDSGGALIGKIALRDPPHFPTDTFFLFCKPGIEFRDTITAVSSGTDDSIHYSILSPVSQEMTVDSNTGIIRWKPTDSNTGVWQIKLAASSRFDLKDTAVVFFIVENDSTKIFRNRNPIHDTTILESQYLPISVDIGSNSLPSSMYHWQINGVDTSSSSFFYFFAGTNTLRKNTIKLTITISGKIYTTQWEVTVENKVFINTSEKSFQLPDKTSVGPGFWKNGRLNLNVQISRNDPHKHGLPVTVTIFDIRGRKLNTFSSRPLAPGIYNLSFYNDVFPTGIPAGIYMCTISLGKYRTSLKLNVQSAL